MVYVDDHWMWHRVILDFENNIVQKRLTSFLAASVMSTYVS